MHDILSARLARLSSAASSDDAKQSFKSDLMDLAKLCQIVPQNDYLLHTVAGPMADVVKLVFGAAALIVALTETSRRQVYFAVLAQLQVTGQLDRLEADEPKRRALLESLILSGSADLVAAHYGTCPKGYLRLLSRLGDRARLPDIYVALHELLCDVPALAQELLGVTNGTVLTDEMVDVMANLPRGSDAVRLAQHFNDLGEYERFIDLYYVLTGHDTLTDAHRLRLSSGEKPSHLLEALYLDLPFPLPAIAAPGLRHIGSGAELVGVAKKFKNCLAIFVTEALKGLHQYYVWSRKGAPAVVLCIQNEAPFGWYLSEMKLANNRSVRGDLKAEVLSLLEHCGVRTGASVENMMRRHRSTDEQIDFDDLFDLDAA